MEIIKNKMRNFFMTFFLFTGFTSNNQMTFQTIRTPDGGKINIAVVDKAEADHLERQFIQKKIIDTAFSTMDNSAYYIDGGQILYRQFKNDIGYILPSINDYKMIQNGNNYYNTSIFNDKGRLVAAFGLRPAKANLFRNYIKKQIYSYEPIDNNGMEFFLLKDGSAIIIRKRTEILSDGYWCSSMNDFDYFYYVIAGKERPKKRTI